MMVLVHVLSVLVGLVLGMLGGGGAILAMPILLYAGHLEPRSAIATSLAVVGATAAAGAIRHGLSGTVRVREGLMYGLAGMVGAFGGARVARLIPAELLVIGFSALMLIAAYFMARPIRVEHPEERRHHPLWALPIGVVLGSLTGAVGAGGGFVIVPALTLLLGIPMRQAIGTSLMVIAMQSFAGVMGHVGQGTIHVQLSLTTAAMAVGGMLVGVAMAKRMQPGRLRQAFAGLMVVAAFYMGGQMLWARTHPVTPVEAPTASLKHS